MYMHVCVCAYTCTCVHECMPVHVCVHVCVHVYIVMSYWYRVSVCTALEEVVSEETFTHIN